MESVNFEYLPIMKVNVLLFNNKITNKNDSSIFSNLFDKIS
jgi:hypothetical protein